MNRLRLALHVLRGRPLMYRIEIYGWQVIRSEHTIVAESKFLGKEDALLSLAGLGGAINSRIDELLATKYRAPP